MKGKWNRKAVMAALLLICGLRLLYSENVFSSLKKIHFFNSVGEYQQAQDILATLDFHSVTREEREQVVDHLFQIGDQLHREGLDEEAEEYYLRIVREYPQYWYAYNRIELMDNRQGALMVDPGNTYQQFVSITKSFESLAIFLSMAVTGLFVAGLIMFFVFALLLFIRYIRLFFSDVLVAGENRLSWPHLALFLLLVFWPLVFGFSWVIFAFVIYGLLWGYLDSGEKRTAIILWILILAAGFLYQFNGLLENRFASEDFKRIQLTYHQKTYPREAVENFSDELKILQAWVYYNNRDYQQALEMINLSGDSYQSKLKFDLLGAIGYHFGNLNDSLTYFNRSLEINDNDPVTLNNFTLVLLQGTDESVLASYEQRFPRIRKIKDEVSVLQKPKVDKSVFWQSLFNFSSGRSFRLMQSVKVTVLSFFQNPLVFYFLVSVFYIFLLRYLLPRYGESVTCSKCEKVLKKSKMHRSYDICDDCYQLFFLKDVIFLEAKSIKSRELAKRNKRRTLLGMGISLVLPGFLFFVRRKYHWFLFSLGFFSFLLTFSLSANRMFRELYSLSPLIMNYLLIFTVIVYVVINALSTLGEKDGA